MPLRILLKGLVLIATLVLLGYAAQVLQSTGMLDQGWIDAQVRGRGLGGEITFLLLTAFTTGVGFPRQVLAFLGGYAFGVIEGTALGLLGTLLGCAFSFIYARWFARDLIAHHFPARLMQFDAVLAGHPFSMALILRLLPVGSNVVTNLIAGVCRVPALPFLAGSTLGFIPQTLIFALIGSGVSVDPVWRIGTGVVLFVISGVIGLRLYQRIRRERHFDAAQDEVTAEREAAEREASG